MNMIAVISDIHSNAVALRAVLDDIAARDIKRIICLGDLVGYGPEPLEVVKMAMDFEFTIKGNHDAAMLNGIPENFNPIARRASEWTRNQIDPMKHTGIFSRTLKRTKEQCWKFLESLPIEVEMGTDLFLHDTPVSPGSSGYVYNTEEAKLAFKRNPHFRRFFIGHSHIPMIFTSSDLILPKHGKKYDFKGQHIVNVGSVGQPRDNDPRSCYVIGDDGITFIRVEYNVEETVQKILDNPELDNFLARRLLLGK
ncbi:MAG: metallophosphoesterase family protein [Planctomycetota bacterium]